MEHPQPYSDEALQQHFRDLTEQLHHAHESWQEAHHRHDMARQIDLINRERAILVQLEGIIAAFQQALQEQLASYGQPPERTPC
jgi:hypothetical protein